MRLQTLVHILTASAFEHWRDTTDWRKANVVLPAYKKGPKLRAANYRPLSLTCILHVVASQIMDHGEKLHLAYKQHGF